MMQARYLAAARFELRRAARHYGEQSPTLAAAFLSEVERALAQVCAFPQASRVLRKPVRRKSLRKFPYSLLYIIESEAIVVVAVMHHRQRPDYWQDRLR